MPASIATSMIGAASAAVRQRLADRLVLASSPAAPSPRSGLASSAAGEPSTQRPSSPMPSARMTPVRTANDLAQKPENTSAIATPPPSAASPASTRTTPGRGCSTADSRSASAGRVRPARYAAATTASCAMPTPMPKAATSGIQDVPAAKLGGTTPRSCSAWRIASASGPPATTPSAPATIETSRASAAISRRTWRGVAPSARSTAVSRRRWAIASENVPATTNSATAPAMPPIAPKIAISDSRSVTRASPGSASAACDGSSTSRPRRSRSRSRTACGSASAITPIELTLPGRAGQAARRRRGEEHAGAPEFLRGGRDTADAECLLAARRGDPELRTDAGAEPRVRDDVGRSRDARPSRSAYGVSCAAAQSWPSTRSPPASAGKETSPTAWATPGTAAARSTSAASSRGPGIGVDRPEIAGEPHAGIGPDDGVGSGEAALAPARSRAPAIRSPVAEASVTASQIATNAPASVAWRARSVCKAMRSMRQPPSPVRRSATASAVGAGARRRRGRRP